MDMQYKAGAKASIKDVRQKMFEHKEQHGVFPDKIIVDFDTFNWMKNRKDFIDTAYSVDKNGKMVFITRGTRVFLFEAEVLIRHSGEFDNDRGEKKFNRSTDISSKDPC